MSNESGAEPNHNGWFKADAWMQRAAAPQEQKRTGRDPKKHLRVTGFQPQLSELQLSSSDESSVGSGD